MQQVFSWGRPRRSIRPCAYRFGRESCFRGRAARRRSKPVAATGDPAFEADGYCASRLFPQSRRLPVGVSGPHPRSRIHPPDRGGPLRRRVHGQLGVERLPGHSRPHLRPPVRARVPPRPRRGGRRRQGQARAGRDLPAEARRRRLQGRHPRPAAAAGRDRRTASASRWSAPARRRSPWRAISRRSATSASCSTATRAPAA